MSARSRIRVRQDCERRPGRPGAWSAKYSDALLTLKLERHRPEQYRERVQVNADITTRPIMAVPPSSMSDDEWAAAEPRPREGGPA